MEDDERYRDILRRYWGYDNFRGIQLDIIRSIGRGCDTIGLMPTGGGKSITFQVPALAMEGLCLVVTPLIALMKDQVARLRQLGIRAAAIYSGLAAEEVARQLDNCVFGGYKFLYVAPERLGSEAFRRRLGHMHVNFVTIDEAHCLSQWGFDFRPSYLNLCQLNELLPGVPLLALTATATERVLTDIREVLKRPGMRLFRMSFERTNLSYVVRPTTDKAAQLVHILRSVPGAAIVYTRSRRGAADTAAMLTRAGIPALYYHAGLPPVEKDVRQDDWQQGHTRVMVATNAFGMGIDKADVRLVVHMDLPDSIEAYFQEAGRAGRDGRRAYAVLLYSEADRAKMLRRVADTFPPKEFVQRVYSSLAYFFQLAVGDGFGVTYEFDLERFCVNFKYFPTRVLSALHILTRTGLILYRDEEEGASRVMFIVQRDELYNLHRLTPRMDRVILSLLRRYTGLFSDYAFIDETLIGRDCGLTPHEVYETLRLLTLERIVHYVPRKNVPRITFLQRRVEESRVVIPPEVYETRREQYVTRLNAMLGYAGGTDCCRSRYLLAYFGETAAADCDHCDVCLSRRPKGGRIEAAAAAIEELARRRGTLAPDETTPDGFAPDEAGAALQMLVRSGRLVRNADGGFTPAS